MIRFGILAAMAALVMLASPVRQPLAQDATMMTPEEGDRVVVYFNRFKPEHFDAARKAMVEGFTQAMEEHGEDRLTFFLVDEKAGDVVTVSFFVNDAEVEPWHAIMSRLKVVKLLDQFRREPLVLQELSVHHIHAVAPPSR